uniref:Uncharacterized protein n=1 Tax=Rhizophora mucronata TaxID=61149 RepID=A0A2P2P253_RHIMU
MFLYMRVESNETSAIKLTYNRKK